MLDNNLLIILKNKQSIDYQRVAGRCVAAVHSELIEMVNSTTTYTGLQYDKKALEIIEKWDCCPTFFHYKGFPGNICLSLNKELVHGIPSERYIVEGDVVTFDLGATHRTGIADAAVTVIKDSPKNRLHVELIDTCRSALMNGIASIKIGQPIGSIGFAIDKTVKKTNFKLITDYGGHFISDEAVHALPFIQNRSQKTDGVHVQNGMTFAIEPLVTIGSSADTYILDDGWTVMTEGISAHFEHTVAVIDDQVEILTK